MVVCNCINRRSHISQRLFKTQSYSASCIVGNASGRCNQSHWSQEEELIIYWSHTIQHRPTTHFQYSCFCPHSSLFQCPHLCLFVPSISLSFLQNHSLPNLIFSGVTHLKMNIFFLFLVRWQWMTERSKNTSVWKIYQGFGSQAPLQQYITTGLGMDDYCQMRRLESVYLTAWWLRWCFLGQWGYNGAS